LKGKLRNFKTVAKDALLLSHGLKNRILGKELSHSVTNGKTIQILGSYTGEM
jgi:hypothetical protein